MTTLREAAKKHLADAERLRADRAEAAKDGAYFERNQCVALIARMAMALGYWAGTAKTAIEGWSEDWHGCVYIDLPAGQVSWHYHDTQSYLFDWLPPYCADWDGHDTSEKYRRVLDRSTMPNARAEKAEAEVERLRERVVRLTQLLANVFDNLNDAPISDEWARLTCDRISAALEVNHDAG